MIHDVAGIRVMILYMYLSIYTCIAAEPRSPCAIYMFQADRMDKKTKFSFLLPECLDTSSFCRILPVKVGW